MGDNSQILKLMRMMNSTPKYWILSPDAVITRSYDDGRPLFPPGETFENKIVLTIPRDNPSILCEYICEKCSDGCYKWEYIGTWDNNLDLLDLDLDKEYDGHHNENLEYDNPILEFRQKVKNDDMDRDDVVRLFMKMQSQLEKYILHIYTEYESLGIRIQDFPKMSEYDKHLYQDDDGDISIIDYNDNLGYHQFTLFNLKDCDKFRENTILSADLDINEFRSKIRSSSGYSNKVDIFQYFDWYHHLKFAGKSKNKDDKPLFKASRVTTDYLYITEYKDTKEHLYQVFCTFKNIHNDYYWEFICNVNDCKPYIEREIEKHIEIEKKREMILEFQKDQQEEKPTYQDSKYDWMRYSAGLNDKQAEIINNRIFNNASTENIGHDKEDIDKILTDSSTSVVKSISISEGLKYMRMKQDKYGTTMSQNITITGNNNSVVGISMNQTGDDGCEQSQTVIIKNAKFEKKKEKKESVFGVLHRALINLAKIVERYTRYLLDRCMDNFF